MLFRKLCHKCCSKKSRASYITHGVPPPEVEDGSFSEESDDVKMQRLERSLEADPLADHARRFLRKGFRQKAAPGRKEAGTGEKSGPTTPTDVPSSRSQEAPTAVMRDPRRRPSTQARATNPGGTSGRESPAPFPYNHAHQLRTPPPSTLARKIYNTKSARFLRAFELGPSSPQEPRVMNAP